jgi:pimeloyl-ACP methyl ester carboxylesterase
MQPGLVALGIGLGLTLAGLGVAAWRPERVLQAEFARQRWRARARAHYRQAGDHRWSYLEAGQGPLIVLVHGFTGSKENWLPVMRELAKRHRVIAPDLPGWGESERHASGNYGPSKQAERLAGFLAVLKETPALLVGHSMGGQIAGLLAARHPDSAERLALISAAGVRFAENEFGRIMLSGRNPFEVKSGRDLRRYFALVFAKPPFVPWPVSQALVLRRRFDTLFERKVLDAIGRGPEAFALEAELHRIRMPVLLLWSHDDRVIDVSAADTFHRGLPHSTTVLLSGCGHMPMMAQPVQVARALEGLL